MLDATLYLPMHFSKCGAKRDEATGRSQFGHVQSMVFFVFAEPNISMSGMSTMVNLRMWMELSIFFCTVFI